MLFRLYVSVKMSCTAKKTRKKSFSVYKEMDF